MIDIEIARKVHNTMSWKYWAGSVASKSLDWVSRPGKPLAKLPFPFGHNVYLDLRRFFPNCQLIVDCGANVGDTVVAYRNHFPKARIDAFEPVAANFDRLRKRLASDENAHPIPLGCGSQKEEVAIALSSDPERHSLSGVASPTGETEKISLTDLDSFYDSEGKDYVIDILKIDVEGFELKVLEGAKDLLQRRRIRSIFAEVGFHHNQPGRTYFGDLNDLLLAKSYAFSGLYNQFRWGAKREVYFANALWLLSDADHSK
ncbi:MAG: FkbM family methyltransferase [Synechococcales bacterium]|nr:FkbM family methyltransferase [Synechococcales bacterium]